jgi:hypothetical protein
MAAGDDLIGTHNRTFIPSYVMGSGAGVAGAGLREGGIFGTQIPGSTHGMGPLRATGSPFRGSLFIGVSVDLGEVIDGLTGLAELTNLLPRGIADYGGKLRDAVIVHTPKGPAREMGPAGDRMGAFAAEAEGGTNEHVEEAAASTAGADVVDEKSLQREMQMLQRQQARGGVGRREFASGLEAPGREAFQGFMDPETGAVNIRSLATSRLTRARGGARVSAPAPRRRRWGAWGGEGSGSLRQSIEVTSVEHSGFASLRATSTNYYAWMVENGFHQVVKPVAKHPTPAIPGFASDVVYSLGLERTGKYDALVQTIAARGKIQAQYAASRRGKRGTGEYEHPGYTSDGIWAETVSFVRRENPKWQPGAHMFQKGYEDFIRVMIPSYESKAFRAVEQLWNQGGSPAGIYFSKFSGGGGRWRNAGTGRFVRGPGG